jgi:hypothetical protein
MALQFYSARYWLPNGNLSANRPANVFPELSNVHASLFADQAGTIPIPNPLSTDGGGLLTFWAAPGNYWVYIDSETFAISVGVTSEESDLSTGTAAGGELNINALNPAAVDITAFTGYVITNFQDGSKPVQTRVDFPDTTVALSGPSLTRQFTWWMVDATGAVVQIGAVPTPQQRRENIVLGFTVYDGSTQIVFEQTIPVILPQPANQMADLMDALGPFSLTLGNHFTPVPGTLSIDKTAGQIFARAFGLFPASPTSPHISVIPAQSPMDFRTCTRADFSDNFLFNALDVGNYDVAGVVTPIPSPATTFTIFRIFGYPLNDVPLQISIQYGQRLYASMQEAIDAIGNVAFVPNPQATFAAAFLGWVVARGDATDLDDLVQARILQAGKFSTP